MKDEVIKLTEIMLKSIKKLTDDQVILLIEGKGKLVFQEMIEKSKNKTPIIPNSQLDEHRYKLYSFTSREEVIQYLSRFKKQEVIELAQSLNVPVASSKTKANIIHDLTEIIIGIKLRKEMYHELKQHRNN
jgi:hypothetical protein